MTYRIVSTSEYEEWFSDLKGSKLRARITDNINRMKDGNFGVTRFVGDGVYEKKINMDGGYRVYYFLQLSHLIVLLIGGIKRTQQRDIERAKKIRKELKCK